MIRFFLHILLLFLTTTLLAQTWEDIIYRIEKKYVNESQYEKALKKFPDFRKKILKKQSPEKQDFIELWLDIYALHLQHEMGSVRGIQEGAVVAIDKALARLRENTAYEASVAVARAAEVLISYGNYQLAIEKVLEAQERLKSLSSYTPHSEAELSLRLARAYAYSGQTQAAQKCAQQLYAFTDTLNVNKKSPRSNKRLVAESYVLKGEIAAQRGEFEKATALFDEAKAKTKRWRSELEKSFFIRVEVLKAQNYFLGEDYALVEKTCQNIFQKGYQFIPLASKAHELMVYYHIMGRKAHMAKDFWILHQKNYLQINKESNSHYAIKNQILRAMIGAAFEVSGEALAFKIFQGILAKSPLPEYHPLRLEVYRRQTDVAYTLTTRDILEAEESILPMYQLYRVLYGNQSPYTHSSLIEYFWFKLKYTQFKAQDALQGIDSANIETIENNLSSEHPLYIKTTDLRAEFYLMIENLSKALELAEKSASLRMNKYGEKDWETGYYYSKLSDVQIECGQYRSAEENSKKAIAIIKRDLGTSALEYADALAVAAKVSLALGMYDEAKKTFQRASNIYRVLSKRNPHLQGRNIENLASLYVQIGEYNFANKQLTALIDRKKEILGLEHRELIKPYLEQANLFLVQGEYGSAEKIASLALNIAQNSLGENSISYAAACEQLAKIYTALGSFQKALDLEAKVLQIRKLVLGEQHVLMAHSLAKLAMLKYMVDAHNLKESENLMTQAEKIILYNFDDHHPMYAEALKDEAMLFIESKKYDLALQKLEKASEILESKLDRKNTISAEIFLMLGDIYLYQDQIRKAEKSYQKAESIYASLLSKKHPYYIRTQSKLAQMHYISGDYKKANEEIEIIIPAYLEFIQKYFPNLSENEKASFWQLMRPDFEFFNSLAIAQAKERPKMLAQMYNHALITKALLLSSSQKLREEVAKSNNLELKELYAKWIEQKEFLLSVLSMNQEQITENQIDVTKLQNEIEIIEKQLSEKSDVFASFFKNNTFTWEDVRKVLRPGEVAIEIVRFRHYEKGFTNQIKYAALIVNHQTQKQPDLVIFENGNDLENRYLTYYRNCMIHAIDDDNSYKVFWQPIENAFPSNTSKVFLSPDGVYNQLNIESFLVENSLYVLDKYYVNLVSNTKELILKRPSVLEVSAKKSKSKHKEKVASSAIVSSSKAVLFGNPRFHSSTSEETPYKIIPLPGTGVEIEQISQILRRKNWQVVEYTDEMATEKALKSESNPTLLHIATHGFFDKSKSEEEFITFSEIVENPLLKSGLLAANAGEVLASGSYNTQEGILTAFEAMSLNYSNTEIVILSACETGLGKVEAGEGVFGLQRSFLTAGADVVIMSIFKVADEVTQKLMTNFYTNWIEKGMKKREAFYAAQKEIRASYPNPIFWGAFNVIGVEKE
ncbi:MAG: CHAT domain-containing protein [Cytophagales bacterium]|nr:CHAT domain-containing protein [Cytophagales bacterium]MDW8384525.1 CHAT domain-containing protein [Flammeovirgaceae bacterium]